MTKLTKTRILGEISGVTPLKNSAQNAVEPSANLAKYIYKAGKTAFKPQKTELNDDIKAINKLNDEQRFMSFLYYYNPSVRTEEDVEEVIKKNQNFNARMAIVAEFWLVAALIYLVCFVTRMSSIHAFSATIMSVAFIYLVSVIALKSSYKNVILAHRRMITLREFLTKHAFTFSFYKKEV